MTNIPIQIGSYRRYTFCRLCLKENLNKVIDLGLVPLAGAFLKLQKPKKENYYPLEIGFCNKCFTLQTMIVVDADEMFQDYFYHSSAIKTLVNHFEDVSEIITSKTKSIPKPFIIEIGCNDATLIKNLVKREVNVLGVDPAQNIVKPLIKEGVPILCNYFTSSLAKRIVSKYGKAHVIFSSNTLAHIEDMRDVLSGVNLLLEKNGELMMEVHYLGNLIKEVQYDMIYHEHQYYWSLTSLSLILKEFNLEIFDVKLLPIHAGSIRFHIGHVGEHAISIKTKQLRAKESSIKLNEKNTFAKFYKRILGEKLALLDLLTSIKAKGKTVAGYGASGRGTILSSFTGLDSKYLEYIIDDALDKQGSFTPFNHLPIVGSSVLNTELKPDFLLLFAWSFFNEIRKRNPKFNKNGGKYIVPLPRARVLR